MDRLKRLILDHEDWLIDRVVHYAHENDYTRFTSTLREAWRASIIGLSVPLCDAVEEIRAKGHASAAPVQAAVAFGVAEARKHRARGIDMALFLGLLKHYRQTYFDLVEEKVPDLEDRRRLTAVLLTMFDSIELGLVREWSGARTDPELERLRAKNRELSNEKNKYLTVFESIAEPAILLDPEDEPVHINTAGGRILLGEETPGASYYGDANIDRLRLLVTSILAHHRRRSEEADRITLQTALGPRTFSIAIQRMLDISSKFAGQVIILKDVTDYLAAIAAAEDAARAKSSFLATVSHEIKTPINSIIGLTELIDDGGLTPAQRRHVASMRASGKVLSELVENILGMSRAEANALQRVDQDFDVCELVEGISRVIDPDARTRGLETSVTFDADVPCRLRGDAQKLRHVLMNLLTNALKYTQRGSVSLRVSLEAGSTAGQPVLGFEVSDTGVGLPPGAIDWLFDPFTQYLHPGLEHGPRGTGLGLAICNRLVTFLGGTISAGPAPGGGSRFVFRLPFAAAETSYAAAGATTGLDVLVVEDDPVNALVCEGYVADLGHRPVVAATYAQALDALRGARFDLVLTDNLLDGASGLDLARCLRESPDRLLNALPVVVVTAAIPDPADIPPGTVQQFIEKPFDRQDLKRAIQLATGAGEAGRHEAGAGRDAVPPVPGRGEPLLDEKVLNRLLTDLGVDRCERVVESYLANAPRLRRSLARGMAANDLAAMLQAAHQMISAASFVGLTAIATRARDLHRHCAARETGKVRATHAEIEEVYDQASEDLLRHWSRTVESYGFRPKADMPRARSAPEPARPPGE